MQQSTKIRAIVVAGAALVAAGAFVTALGEEKEASGGGTAPIVSSGKMTLGETATTTTPPTAALVSVAVPTVKATAPCGFTSGC
jgi:hypothetical protein